MLLGVNIDHIATLRQARYATMLDSFNVEPSVLDAAYAAQRGGADSITLHVRGDRRHMQDADALSVRESVALPLNLYPGDGGFCPAAETGLYLHGSGEARGNHYGRRPGRRFS